MSESIFLRKSLVGPGKWKPVSSLSAADRKIKLQDLAARVGDKNKVPYTQSYGMSKETKAANKARNKYQELVDFSGSMKRKSKVPGMHTAKIDNPLYGGAASITGSKRNAQRTLFKGPASQYMRNPIAHEMEHLRPKRSGFRLAEVMSTPKKLGREEARADYFGGGVTSNTKNPKLGETIYATVGRVKRQHGKIERDSLIRSNYDPLLGGNANKFAGAYNKAQSKFARNGASLGQRTKENSEYALKNFNVKPKETRGGKPRGFRGSF